MGEGPLPGEAASMKKSISIETMFGDLPFYDRFGKVREAGVDWVEFSGWTELDFSRITEELQQNRLGLASMAGSDRHSLVDPDQRDDFLEFLSQSIAVAKSFDCRNLIIETGADGGSTPLANASRDDFVKASAATRTLDDAARKAARAGVTLYLKPVRLGLTRTIGMESLPSAGDVVKVVNSPALRLLLDTRQAALDEGADAAMRRFRELVGYVHIGMKLGPEELAGFRRVLEEVGYAGTVGFTYRSTSEDADTGLIRGF